MTKSKWRCDSNRYKLTVNCKKTSVQCQKWKSSDQEE